MVAQPKFAHEIPLDRPRDLDALVKFLSSDRAPTGSMRLSDLDGFLTGIAVGPELILPSEWLPAVWGGEAPEFADEEEAEAILGSVMGRYNEIIRRLAAAELDPIYWEDGDGSAIPLDWAEGFLQAIILRADAWEPLFRAPEGVLLLPILGLCGDENGESLLGLPPEEEDRLIDDAVEFIPACVAEIDAYWRGRGSRQTSMPRLPGRPHAEPLHQPAKTGRNEPCPCGSGKKFKKCCGKAA